MDEEGVGPVGFVATWDGNARELENQLSAGLYLDWIQPTADAAIAYATTKAVSFVTIGPRPDTMFILQGHKVLWKTPIQKE